MWMWPTCPAHQSQRVVATCRVPQQHLPVSVDCRMMHWVGWEEAYQPYRVCVQRPPPPPSDG